MTFMPLPRVVQAKKLGLVDELGGFAKALDRTRSEIGSDPESPVSIRRFPAPKPPWETALELVKSPLITLQALSDFIGLTVDPGAVSAPPVLIR